MCNIQKIVYKYDLSVSIVSIVSIVHVFFVRVKLHSNYVGTEFDQSSRRKQIVDSISKYKLNIHVSRGKVRNDGVKPYVSHIRRCCGNDTVSNAANS